MSRPVTLFTGQWADLPFTIMAEKAAAFGYDGLELACWGDHLDVWSAAATNEPHCQSRHNILAQYGLKVWAISNHLIGQIVGDLGDQRTDPWVPEKYRGNPQQKRLYAIETMKATAHAAKNLGVKVVNGFVGSPIWHYVYSFPPVPPAEIEAGFQRVAELWTPILDEFKRVDVKFALEVHPTETAFDTVSAARLLKAFNDHPAFGFNYDPSHLVYQNVDYVGFLREFRDRIFHVHMKDAYLSPTPKRAGIFGGHTNFGDPERSWDFRSLGRGSVDFEEIIRALNEINYQGPLSVEWEDSGMDRDHGAKEACTFVRTLDFPPSGLAFDKAFSE